MLIAIALHECLLTFVRAFKMDGSEGMAAELWINLKFSWAGQAFEVSVAESDRCVLLQRSLPRTLVNSIRIHRVYDLKSKLFSLTNVPPERQKILGLVKGKLPPDGEAM